MSVTYAPTHQRHANHPAPFTYLQTGMCEAFEGAKKKTTTATCCSPASSMGSVDFWEEYAAQHQNQHQQAAGSKQGNKASVPTASVPMEAAALLREAAAVLDCIASK